MNKQNSADWTLSKWDVLLDNEANIAVFNNKLLLSDVRDTSSPLNVIGIGGASIQVHKKGEFDYFGTVWYHPDASANILPLCTVEEKYDVQYIQGCLLLRSMKTLNSSLQNVLTDYMHVICRLCSTNISS